MARSCGIHIDQRRFHLVALEGSAKKARVVATGSGEIRPGADPVSEVSSALRKLVKKHSIRAENVGLAVDSGLAAFRNLTVPFDDRSKIEDIIRFEVESDLPQWSIDDVVIDFLVLTRKPGVESHLLVTALPKARLEPQLEACERGGVEATTAELDGTALFQAAHSGGHLAEDAAQVLVHVGDASTTVVVADGGRLVSIRAIRAGAALHVGPSSVVGEGDEPEEGAEPVPAPDTADPEARLAKTALRIRRELGRTVSGAVTEHPIEAIYLCGHRLEGLSEETLFDVPVLSLAGLGVSEGGELDDAEAAALVVAQGAALRALGGGVLEPELRRDDLRYSGKFERLELPLAVLALLLCTLLGVKLIVTMKQIDWRDEGNVATSPGDMQLWAHYSNIYLLPNAETGWPGRLKEPTEDIQKWIDAIEAGSDQTRTKYQELVAFKNLLAKKVGDLKEQVGVATTGFKQPQSALHAQLLVMGVLNEMGDQVGRFGLRHVEANYRQGRRDNPDSVEVRLDMDFFARDGVEASRNYSAMREAMRSQPWCVEFPERPSRPFPDGGGISYDGLTITVDVEKAIAEEETAS